MTNKNYMIKVNMSGKEYTKLMESKKIKLTKKQEKYLKWGGISILTLFFIAIIVDIIIPSQNTPIAFESIIKFMGIALGISWILHGFQLRILA